MHGYSYQLLSLINISYNRHTILQPHQRESDVFLLVHALAHEALAQSPHVRTTKVLLPEGYGD